MNILDLFFGGSTRGNRQLQAEMKRLREPKSKYYRLVQAVSWILIGIAVAAMLLSLIPVLSFLHDHQNVVLKGSLVIIAIGVGAQAALPWINFIERSNRLKAAGRQIPAWYKPLAIGFFVAIGICTVLWVIAVFIIHLDTFARLIEKTGEAVTGEEGTIKQGDGALLFLAISVVASIQVIFLTWVVTSILYYKKKHVVIRVISYICGALTEIWASWVLAGFLSGNLYTTSGALMVPLDPSKIVLFIGILAVVGLLISNSFRASFVYRERLKAVMQGKTTALSATDEDLLDETYEKSPWDGDASSRPAAPKPANGEKSAEEKLQELKSLHDKGILTDEEYAKKRQDVIDKM